MGALIGALGFFFVLDRAYRNAPLEAELMVPEIERMTFESDLLPERLGIPSIEVDTFVEEVGITAQNEMATPKKFSNVGWYRYGTIPGATGSAVIAGHRDNALGLPGPFKKLDQLKTGDEIFIETEDGTELRFVVRETAVYDYRNAPLSKIFERSDAAWLTLITCAGQWLPQQKTYDERLVVYAERV